MKPTLTPEETVIANKILGRLQKYHRTYKDARTSTMIIDGLKKTGVEINGQTFRKIINVLRKKGYPICSKGRGYWYSANLKEVIDQRNSLMKRVRKIMEAVDGLDRHIDKHKINKAA
jgi:translation initiation factor 1 (eIF-1/SUI1)